MEGENAPQRRHGGSRWRGVGGSLLRRRESPEGGGGSSSSGHTFSFSTSFTTSRSVYFGRSSGSLDDDIWPHRNSLSSSIITSGSSSTTTTTTTRSLRLAFHGRRGGERGERTEAGDSALPARVATRADHEVSHGRRRLFFSLVDSEGSSRSRPTEYCLEDTETLAGEGMMLPGVEVARRRRVRLAETYEAGGGGISGAGSHDVSGHSSRSSRSGVAVAHHHHQRYHVHHQAPRSQSRPGTPRPGSLVRRMQDILQEHRARSPAQPITISADRTNAVDASTNHGPHRSSRGHGHRSGEIEARAAPFSSLWRRQSSDSSSTLRGAALEARNRLDERLRAAAHASHSRRNWQPVQSSYDMNLLFSDDEDESPVSDDDSWETSLHEWLAAWAPSVDERWNRVESSSSGRAGSSRTPSFKPRSSEGLSKAAINALPRQVVGSGTQGGSTRKLEQEDCPVCLEGFIIGQSLMSLPCNHRFHPDCLSPWLASHGQCPYCRADIVKANDHPEQKSSGRLMGGNDEDLLSWVEAIERGMDQLSYS